MIKKHQQITGFTLIELLVAISIIVLLSGFALFALMGAREQARDATRKADLESIRSAFELFKADCGVYPNDLPPGSLQGSSTLGCTYPNTNTYLKSVPTDPQSDAEYHHNGDTTNYRICSHLETGSGSVTGTLCDPTPCRYCVTNP